MKRIPMIASLIAMTVVAGAATYAVKTVAVSVAEPVPRVLFIGKADDAGWQRTLDGARDAAQQFGVELSAQAPLEGNAVDEQRALVQGIDLSTFAGVAIAPVDPLLQGEMINEMASRTKLVTVGKDFENSKRLCHVGYCPMNAGRKAAQIVGDQMWQQSGKIALMVPVLSGADDRVERERLEGFREKWTNLAAENPAMHCSIIEVEADSNDLGQLAKTLSDPELRMIVAFDTTATEAAIGVTAKLPAAHRPAVLAFDPNAAVFDAIEDGRVCSAIVDDPYRDGFEAIQRLAMYTRGDEFVLPIAGHGNIPLTGEVVQKENLAIYRQHI
jgi:LacI family transcriptional regulator